MENQNSPLSRKKFLFWGISASSLLALPAFLRFSKKKKEAKTVRMLTQDGKLVEIQLGHIPSKKKKIDDQEILTWVKRETKL